jgi:NADH-quinone oxidoreductase subunit C
MTDNTAAPIDPPPLPKTPLQELAEYIYGQRGSDVLAWDITAQGPRVKPEGPYPGELSLTVRRDHIVPFLTFLRDDDRTAFNQLVDLCGVDHPENDERFTVVYNLLSMRHNMRVRVKVTTADQAAVPSVADVFATANWFEREAYDLFGIYFSGHPDLRRLLTDYGFEGHPLRKDFPMTGFVELRYDSLEKRVKYAPVQLTQDYRVFDTMSPWEGMTDLQLPGDEKTTKPKVGYVPARKEVG